MANEDLKAQMREALDRKNDHEKGVHGDTPVQEKAHGSEVAEKNAGAHMHRRQPGGRGNNT